MMYLLTMLLTSQLDFVLASKADGGEVAQAMATHARERMAVRTVSAVIDRRPTTFNIRFEDFMEVCVWRNVGHCSIHHTPCRPTAA